MKQWATRRGFTIVELLIVIVVIAILASITIVTYTFVRQDSYNARINAGVAQYVEAIQAYYSLNGSYPTTTPENNGDHIAMICLGTGYPSHQCGTVSGADVSEDSLFNSEMQNVLTGNPPALGDAAIKVGSETYIGASYGLDATTHSSTGYARMVEYALNGANQDCKVAGAWAYNSSTTPATTACEIDFEEVPAR